MFQYEIFRLSMIGGFFIGSFLFLASPYLDFHKFHSVNGIIILIAGLITSPVVGYLFGQLVTAYYLFTKSRPNDTKIDIEYLHSEFNEIVSSNISYKTLVPLCSLTPKELHRFVWVAYANRDLRNRSESYWERYYSNVGISIAIVLGTLTAIPFCVNITELIWNNSIKCFTAIALLVILWVVNRYYLRVCATIENVWIKSFLSELDSNPEYFSKEIFKR